MFNCLELFSGTGSFGKVAKELDYNVVSLDLILKADIQINIMDWDYKSYPKNSFDIIWASPPCTAYSQLKKCWYNRKLKDGTIYSKELHEDEMNQSDHIIKRTLDIINYFNPLIWFIENPLSTLKDRQIMKNIPYYICDYCKYSDWGYKKRTCIWTNKEEWTALKCNNDCENMINLDNQKLHRERMGTSKTIKDEDKIIRCNTKELREKYKDYTNLQKYGLHGTTLEQRYRVPPKLIFSLLTE